MKKELVTLLASLLLFSGLVSCSGNSDSKSSDEDSIEMTPYGERRRLAPDEVKKQREAAIILVEYVRLDGDRYILDISEEDAAALGVAPENYRYACEDIVNTNIFIQQHKAAGDTVDLFDPAVEFEKLKNKMTRE